MAGLCRQCDVRPIYEADAILCEECYEETRQNHQHKIAEDAEGKKFGHKVLLVIGAIAIVFLIARCHSPGNDLSEGLPASDGRAYDELRARGYSESEARDAAPSVRRLCEAGGGTDCS